MLDKTDSSKLTILKNFMSLSVLNVMNLLMPLISLPYLVRVVGVENYGEVSFALVIIQYLVLLLNYGFPISATKQIAENRANVRKTSEIVSNILLIKIVLGIGLFLLLVLSLILMKFSITLVVYSFGIVLGEILNFTWLYQGMEKMKFITIVNFISKGGYTLLVFIVITTKSDYPYVCLLTSIGYLTAGIVSLFIALKVFKLNLQRPTKEGVRGQLHDGWYIFLSTVGINLYRNSNIFILGLLTNNGVVGLYSASEKLIKALQSPVSALSESMFPYFSRKFSKREAEKESLASLFTVSKYYVFFLGLYALTVFLLANYLTQLFLGSEFSRSTLNIKVMSGVLLIGGLNYLFGVVGMVNLDMKKQFANFVLVSGIVGIVIVSVFANTLFDLAGSLAFLTSESVLLFLSLKALHYYQKKNKFFYGH